MSQIQILGLRKFFSKKAQKEIVTERFFEKGWRAPDVATLFKNIDAYLEPIPNDQRYNLYYTIAQCKEEKGRIMTRQEAMPFDVDGIDVDRRREYVEPICETLGIKSSETGIIFTGNGLQFIIGLKEPFTSEEFFEENRAHYKATCERINAKIRLLGLPGTADSSVFSPARLMRLPKTMNCKRLLKNVEYPDRMGEMYHDTIVPVDFVLSRASGVPKVSDADQISPGEFKKFPNADTETILKDCAFMRACKKNPAELNEAQWYAMLSISARFKNGAKISHELSEGHPGYTHQETEQKIEQALAASGPRTCTGIDALWGKCKECKLYNKIKSPILIQGKNFIATEDQGFHVTTKNGRKIPQYEDLRRYFKKQTPYVVLGESEICMTYNGKYWEDFPDAYLKNFAQENFRPAADTTMVNEFKNLVCRTELRDVEWFKRTTRRMINFQNGVLDTDTLELKPHSPEYGFNYVLPYAYEPQAECPRFDQFMKEVTGDDEEVEQLLLEFSGYALSSDSCWGEKALVLTGEGSNGKSTFMNVLKDLAGIKNYASLGLIELKDPVNRRQLDGALFNMAEETPAYGLRDTTLLKNLVTGGEMIVKQLYKQPYTVRNRCKFIFACNDLPRTEDTSKGYFRRLLIVRFSQEFEGDKKDPFIIDKLRSELPGIFNQVLKSYRALAERKRFTTPGAVQDEIENYTLVIDSVKSWVMNCVEVLEDDQAEVSLDNMYSAYKFYAEERGEKPKPYTGFSKSLTHLIPGFNKRKARRRDAGSRKYFLKGVKFAGGSLS